jgi:hypothetical protein
MNEDFPRENGPQQILILPTNIVKCLPKMAFYKSLNMFFYGVLFMNNMLLAWV